MDVPENNGRMDKTVVRKGNLKDQGNDFNFWQTQTIEKRLETLEDLRTQFITWKYGTEQGFQRIYRIIERS
jgi:hypothetical protein